MQLFQNVLDNNDITLMQILYKNDKQIDTYSNYVFDGNRKYFAFAYACRFSNENMINYMIKKMKYLSINKPFYIDDEEEDIPINILIHTNKIDSLRCLIKHRPEVQVNVKNKYDICPLILAFRTKNLEAIRLLLNHKYINVNCQEPNSGLTPLMFCSRNHPTTLCLAKKIIKHKNTNYTLQNNDNQTIFDMVLEYNNKPLYRLIRKKI